MNRIKIEKKYKILDLIKEKESNSTNSDNFDKKNSANSDNFDKKSLKLSEKSIK